jgi:ABC-type spermidine/putrescine transport system permease subunit I
LRFGKFSAIILLNILHIPSACTSSPSSMSIIHRFGLLNELLSLCVFLSKLLSLLSKNFSVFFFIIYFCLES